MNTAKPDVLTIVTAYTWDGEPYSRTLRPGWSVCLRGEYGTGFDVHGPHAWSCPDCGEVLFVDHRHEVTTVGQHHYAAEHGYTPALLP